MANQTVITAEAYKRLQSDLEELKVVRRKEIAEKIKVALSFGDLSENSEYDEAKNEQAIIEGRIAELEAQLKDARILDESELTTENVHIGSLVQIRQKDTETVREFRIVGSTEANPASGKISDESPVGRAILGHKEGDTVEVEIPSGFVTYVIEKISK